MFMYQLSPHTPAEPVFDPVEPRTKLHWKLALTSACQTPQQLLRPQPRLRQEKGLTASPSAGQQLRGGSRRRSTKQHVCNGDLPSSTPHCTTGDTESQGNGVTGDHERTTSDTGGNGAERGKTEPAMRNTKGKAKQGRGGMPRGPQQLLGAPQQPRWHQHSAGNPATSGPRGGTERPRAAAGTSP